MSICSENSKTISRFVFHYYFHLKVYFGCFISHSIAKQHLFQAENIKCISAIYFSNNINLVSMCVFVCMSRCYTTLVYFVHQHHKCSAFSIERITKRAFRLLFIFIVHCFYVPNILFTLIPIDAILMLLLSIFS